LRGLFFLGGKIGGGKIIKIGYRKVSALCKSRSAL